MRWLAFLLAVPAFGLGPVLPDFLPAGTNFVIGVQLHRVLESPLGKKFGAEAAKLPQAQFGGIDFARDVDEILIAGNAKDNNEALLVLKGRFTGTGVISDPKMPKALLAFLDASTAIAGDAALVRAALDLHGKGAPPHAGLETRIASFAGQYDIWGAGDNIDPVDGFSFGANLSQGLDIAAEIHVRSAADVAKINDTLKPFQAMLRSQAGASKFNVQMQGRTLKISMTVPQAELEKAMEAQKQALTAAILQQMSPHLQIAPKPAQTKPKDPGRILTDERGNTVSVRLPGGQ